jgi:hypothetical protein
MGLLSGYGAHPNPLYSMAILAPTFLGAGAGLAALGAEGAAGAGASTAAVPQMDTLASGGYVFGNATPWTNPVTGAIGGAAAGASDGFIGGSMAPTPAMDTLSGGGMSYGDANIYTNPAGPSATPSSYGANELATWKGGQQGANGFGAMDIAGNAPSQFSLTDSLLSTLEKQIIKKGIGYGMGLLSGGKPQMAAMPGAQATVPNFTYNKATFSAPQAAAALRAKQAASVNGQFLGPDQMKSLGNYLTLKKDWLAPYQQEEK